MYGGDHRKHDAQLAAGCGTQQRAHLAAQQARTVEPEPDRAPAERGIFLFHIAHIGKDFVAANIERAESHGLARRGVEHGAIERKLFAGARELRRHHKLEFRKYAADRPADRH